VARKLRILPVMSSQTHPTPEERRASVERIVAASGGRAPAGVRFIEFRKASPQARAIAEEMRPRARRALERDAARRQAAA
jgi:hypothetical protein